MMPCGQRKGCDDFTALTLRSDSPESYEKNEAERGKKRAKTKGTLRKRGPACEGGSMLRCRP